MKNFKKISKSEVKSKHTIKSKIRKLKKKVLRTIEAYKKLFDNYEKLKSRLERTPVKRGSKWNKTKCNINRQIHKPIQTQYINVDSLSDFKKRHGRSMTNYERHQFAKGEWDGQDPKVLVLKRMERKVQKADNHLKAA